jgi:hypothetical protein
MREAYPSGFIWACCKKKMNAKGCEVRPHEPKDVPKRKKLAAVLRRDASAGNSKPLPKNGASTSFPNSYLDPKTEKWFAIGTKPPVGASS